MLAPLPGCGPADDASSTDARQQAVGGFSEDPGAVVLEPACVAHIPEGETYAVFVHANTLDVPVVVPPGDRNWLWPDTEPPPTTFAPGRGAFSVPLSQQYGFAVWQFDGREEWVTYDSQPCELLEDQAGWAVVIGNEVLRPRFPEDPPVAPPPIIDTEVIPGSEQMPRTPGATPGELDVTDDGAVRYTIPIRVPAGRKGVEPALSLAYNSRGGNGLVGVGWSLTGLSTIHRCRKNHATHAEQSAIRFELDGAYCLDGEPLLEVGGGSQWGMREYRTERDRFARIVMDSADAAGPTSFTVYSKDGRIQRYGNRPDAILGGYPVIPNVKLPATTIDVEYGAQVRYAWSLSEVADRSGNTMTIQYEISDPCMFGPYPGAECGVEHTPKEIRYTYGNLHPYANRAVRFWYEPRPDAQTRYISGLRTHQRNRLSSIEVIGPKGTSESTVRTYRLSYETGAVSGRSLLRSVQECDPYGVCLAPTEFEWYMGDPDFEKVTVDLPDVGYFLPFFQRVPIDPSSSSTKFRSVAMPQGLYWAMLVLDINGDGRDDLLYRKPSRTFAYDEWIELDQYGAQKSGSVVDFVWTSRIAGEGGAAFGPPRDAGLPRQFATDYQIWKAVPRPADIDGDGRTDVAMPDGVACTPTPLAWCYRTWSWYRSDGASGFTLVSSEAATDVTGVDPLHFADEGWVSLRQPHMVIADIDGDRRPDPLRNTLHTWASGSPVLAWAVGDLGPAGPSYQPLYEPGAYFHSPRDHEFNVYTADVDASGRRAFVFPGLRINTLPFGFEDEGWYRAALAPRPGALPWLPLLDLPRADKTPAGFRYLFLDVNGDGNSDALQIPNAGGWPNIAINAGSVGAALGPSGFFPAAPAMSPSSPLPGEHAFPVFDEAIDSALRVFDYNQDGQSDVLFLGHTPPVVYQSNPDGLFLQKFLTYDGLGSTPTVYSAGGHPLSQLLDHDGNGLTDFTSLNTGPFWMVYPPAPEPHLSVGIEKPSWYSLNVYRRKGVRADMISVIHDGLARRATGSHRIEYRAHSGRASVFTAYPTSPVTRGLWVVDRHWSDTATEGVGDDGYAQYVHTYEDGLNDLLGRGWLGFRRITVRHQQTGTLTTKEFQNDVRFGTHYPFAGRPMSIETEVTPAGSPTHHRRTDHSYSIISGSPFFAGTPYAMAETYVLEQEMQGVDVRASETSAAHDAFGNVVYRVRWNLGPTPSVEEEEHLVNNREDIWLLGMVTDSIVTSTRGGETVRRTYHYDYDTYTGNRIAEIREPGDPALQLATYTVHNAEGMPGARVVGTLPRWTTVSYNVDGIEPAKITNPLGQVTSFVYDRGLGVPIKAEDPNGVVVRWQYDRFGRLRATIPSGGATTEVHYSAASAPFTITETSTSGESRIVDHDRLGRVTRERSRMLDGSWSTVDTVYDKRFGELPAAISRPYSSLAERVFTTYAYDDLGREVRVTHPDGSTKQTEHHLTEIKETDEVGRVRRLLLDDLGQTSRSVEYLDDGTATFLEYAYGPFGLQTKVIDALGNELRLTYDTIGRLVQQDDPDRGTEHFEYDEVDALVVRVGPEGPTTYVRDLLGRVVARGDKDGSAFFAWDTSPNGIGKLASSTSPDGVIIGFAYDGFGRPSQTQYTIGGASYLLDQSYDSFGRVEDVTYPAVGAEPRLTVRRSYAANGEWVAAGTPGGTEYWRAEARNAAGDLTSERFGNGLRTRRRFDANRGHLVRIDTGAGIGPSDEGTVQALRYEQNADGNLAWRVDRRTAGGPQTEVFQYDSLDRLTGWSIAGQGAVTYTYDVIGNLTERKAVTTGGTDVTTFRFDGVDAAGRFVGPHVLTDASYGGFEYDAAGQQIAAPGRRVDFTAAGLPRRVVESGVATDVRYDAFQDRAEKSSPAGTTVYVGGLYEKRTTGTGTEHVFLIAGPERSVAQVTWKETGTGLTRRTSYLHDERQGSIGTITDATGAIEERLRFDPYGRRVNPDLPLVAGTAPTKGVRIGYTGHDHDDELGLVDMDGRMYDPRAMRFISPDPLVADPTRSQALNRYAYVMNNPTRYTDPSGYSPRSSSTTPDSPGECINTAERFTGTEGTWTCNDSAGTYSSVPPGYDDNGQQNGVRGSAQSGASVQTAGPRVGDHKIVEGPNGPVVYTYRSEGLGWQVDLDTPLAAGGSIEQGHALGPENDPYAAGRSFWHPTTDSEAEYNIWAQEDMARSVEKLADAAEGGVVKPIGKPSVMGKARRPPPGGPRLPKAPPAYMKKTHWLYILVRKGEILKYGTTVNTFERYPMWVGKMFGMYDVEMIVLKEGSYTTIRTIENQLIKAHTEAFGARPRWNPVNH